jgi:pSer/pThr/pTyr-binding forkhead associated (FHA) protein
MMLVFIVLAIVLLAIVLGVIGTLILVLWRAVGRRPVPMVAVITGAMGFLWIFTGHLLPTLAFAFMLGLFGIAFWRSRRVRAFVSALVGRLHVAWFLSSGVGDELRGRGNPQQQIGVRAIRQVKHHVRAGVKSGERQLPTNVTVFLHPDDLADIGPLDDALCDELAEQLRLEAKKNGYRTFAPPTVRLARDPDPGRRRFPRVEVSWHEKDEPTTGPARHDGVSQEKTRVHLQPALRRIDEFGDPVEVLVPDAQVLRLGRDPDKVDVLISDEHVSRHHADVGREGASAWVKDNHSKNWTLLNGERVLIRTPIINGDIITIGRDMRFQYFSPEETTGKNDRR